MIHRVSNYLRPPLAVLIGCFLMLALSVPSTALEQVFIQKSGTNPQTRAANNYINQASPNTVNANALQVESLLLGNQRALLLFDLSLLPNVAIKNAQLILTVQTRPTGNRSYGVFPLASFFTQPNVTWNTRVADLAWGAAGGDIPSTPTDTSIITGSSRTTQVTWNVTPDVQSWYSGNASGPVPNFGELIKDQTENSVLPAQTVFESNTGASPPQLSIQFVQNVANLSATAGNNQVTLNWTYPAAIGTVVDPTTGVLILRRAGAPVDQNSLPVDQKNYTLCSTIGTGTVVFTNASLATTFTDNSSDTCGAPADGTVYYYKVFTEDSLRNYSATDTGSPATAAPGGSVNVPEVSAMPSASAPYASNWILNTYTTNLAPPSLFPGLVAMVGTQSDFLFAVNPSTGLRPYPPVSLGNAISGRSPVIDAGDSSTGQDMVYVADQSGLAYGIAADTGQIVWAVDPLNSGGTPFFAAGALVVKSFATSSYTRTDDLLVLGTRNSATTTGNAIVGVDANTGATAWSDVGGSGGILSMDMINSTPFVSYTKNAIWVTSRSAGGTSQPSLWELNANTGAVMAALNLGDIDSSPVLTPDESVLFVGNNVGTIYAINTSTATVITSIAGGDGAPVGYPAIVGSSSGFSLYFSGNTAVHGLTYNTTAKTFTANWSTPVTAPSAPIAVGGLNDVYAGSGDGTIHELNATTGGNIRDLAVDVGLVPVPVVGDPSLDVSLMHIYVSVSDQRMYSFPFPF